MDDRITCEPLEDKTGCIGVCFTILKPEHDRKYILVWKPGGKWYGKVRFPDASITMPEAKAIFLREKFGLDEYAERQYALYTDGVSVND